MYYLLKRCIVLDYILNISVINVEWEGESNVILG